MELVLQKPFACIAEIAKIAKQHDDLALLVEQGQRRPVGRPSRPYQRDDRNVARRAQLTGEPYVGWSTDPAKRGLLVGGRRRGFFSPRCDTHAASRTARPAPAHRSVWQVEASARFQHRPTPWHAHRLLGIGDRYQALATALQEIANFARDERRSDDGKIAVE